MSVLSLIRWRVPHSIALYWRPLPVNTDEMYNNITHKIWVCICPFFHYKPTRAFTCIFCFPSQKKIHKLPHVFLDLKINREKQLGINILASIFIAQITHSWQVDYIFSQLVVLSVQIWHTKQGVQEWKDWDVISIGRKYRNCLSRDERESRSVSGGVARPSGQPVTLPIRTSSHVDGCLNDQSAA